MPQWLRMLIALAENLRFVLNTHMAAHNHLQLQFQLLLTSTGTALLCRRT